MLGFKAFSCLLLAATTLGKYIVPGGRWRDTDGNLVNAHAGSIVHDDETGKFWLFGEYKTQGQTEGGGVSVYSSDDLASWTGHGLALSTSSYSQKKDRANELTSANRKSHIHLTKNDHPTTKSSP